jgi:hypothetical protein
LIKFIKLSTMKLYVNLIPALGYALVTMFSNMSGLAESVEKPSGTKQRITMSCLPKAHDRQNGYVTVAKDGQLILSNGHGSTNLVWRIPSTTDHQWPMPVQG